MANDIKTFQSEFIDCRKNIQIPLLQRDYVQGGRKDVIEPFLEKLLSAIKEESSQVNLNYIYGYDKGNGFVPIDGQQRLITLWLLHLYIYAKKSQEFPVKLTFQSREFANYFCERLQIKLSEILKNTEIKLKDCIVDSPWFVSGWLYDATVNNMLNTLDLIHKKIEGTNIDNTYTQNITFDFLNMEDKGLEDDVYVKMNGRGRPLSYFENLKSLMDEQVKTIFGKDNKFTEDWRIKMDNEWTDLFWNNRNKNQEYSEEIDDEQLRLFYSMLLLYWKQNESEFCMNESYDKGNVFKALLDCKRLISLYQIEKLALFNKNVFQFINESLNVINVIGESVNRLPNQITDILELDSDNTTILYKIALKDTSYEKKLPLLYALVKTPLSYRNENMLYKWVRIWRNLILNSNIGNENIGNVCKTIENVSKMVSDDNLYEVLSNMKWERGSGFNEDQFNEEIAKAKQIFNGEPRSDGKSWEEIIIEAENYAFFKGAIRFLFQNENGDIDINQSTGIWNTENFDTKWNNAKKFFCENLAIDGIQLFKDFIKIVPQFDNLKEFYYGNTINNWRNWILLNKKLSYSTNSFLIDNNIEPTHSDWSEKQKLALNDITNGNILDGISDDYELIVSNNQILLTITGRGNGQEWKKYYIGNSRNKILYNCYGGKLCEKNKFKDKIYTDHKNDKCSFFWGNNIDFIYKDGNFRWCGNPSDNELDIYLMNENWNNYIKRSNPTKDKNTEEDTLYCFKITKDMENDPSLFIKQLDCILEQASNDAKEWVTNIYKTNQRDAKIEENSLYISGNNLTIILFVKNLTPRWGVKCEQTASKEYQDQIISKIKDLNFGNMHFNDDGYLVWSETSYKNGESRFKKLIEVLSEYKIEQ